MRDCEDMQFAVLPRDDGDVLKAISQEATDQVAFMGVSLMSTNFFSKQTITRYAGKFGAWNSPFALVVADSLEEINYRFLKGLPAHLARAKARTIGKSLVNGYSRLRAGCPGLFPVLSSKIEQEAEYIPFRDLVTDAFGADPLFRHEVQCELVSNIGSRAYQYMARESAGKPLFEDYLVREIAISLFLCSYWRDKAVTQVSPSGNSLLRRLHSFESFRKAMNLDPHRLQYVAWSPQELTHVNS